MQLPNRSSAAIATVLLALSFGCERTVSTQVDDHVSGAAGVGASAQGQPIRIAGAVHVRAIGPLRTEGDRHLRPGMLFSSGQLAVVNDTGYAKLLELGIKTVVDFRSAQETVAAPDAPWVIRSTRYLRLDLPQQKSLSRESFAVTLTALEPKLPALFAHLGKDGGVPALLHCSTGQGRACLGMAVVLLALGVSFADVGIEFASNQDEDAVDRHSLDGVFEHIRASGSIDDYLSSQGVNRADLSSFRNYLLQ